MGREPCDGLFHLESDNHYRKLEQSTQELARMYYLIIERSTQRLVHEHFERLVNLDSLSVEEFLKRHCEANSLVLANHQCVVIDQPRLAHFEHGRYVLNLETLCIEEDPLWRPTPRVERTLIPATDIQTGESNV